MYTAKGGERTEARKNWWSEIEIGRTKRTRAVRFTYFQKIRSKRCVILIPPLLPFSLRRILSRSKSCIEPGTIFEFPVPFETIVDEYAADQKLMVEEEVDRRKNVLDNVTVTYVCGPRSHVGRLHVSRNGEEG